MHLARDLDRPLDPPVAGTSGPALHLLAVPTDFAALVRAHQSAVCATAYAVLRDRARSEEVAQDAFLIAWRKLPAMSPAPPLPAWICGIARNLARNVARKRKETAMDSAPDLVSSTTPLDDALAREQHAVASRALALLSESDREIVVMYYRGEDESLRSVATALGITEATARQRLHRGRERLRSAVSAVEAALRAMRPSTAFTAACVAALAAGVAPADAEAAPFTPATTSALPLALGAVALAAIGGGVAIAVVARDPAPRTEAAPATAAVAAPSTSTAPPPPSAERAGLVTRITATQRTAQLARVQHALAQRPQAAAAPAPDKIYDFAGSRLDQIEIPSPAPTGPLSKTTIRYAIKLVQPLVLECLADPDAHGTLDVRLLLAGEPGSATVVESVDIAGEPPLSDDAAFVECVTSALETIELPAMTAAERWQVAYPFVL